MGMSEEGLFRHMERIETKLEKVREELEVANEQAVLSKCCLLRIERQLEQKLNDQPVKLSLLVYAALGVIVGLLFLIATRMPV